MKAMTSAQSWEISFVMCMLTASISRERHMPTRTKRQAIRDMQSRRRSSQRVSVIHVRLASESKLARRTHAFLNAPEQKQNPGVQLTSAYCRCTNVQARIVHLWGATDFNSIIPAVVNNSRQTTNTGVNLPGADTRASTLYSNTATHWP